MLSFIKKINNQTLPSFIVIAAVVYAFLAYFPFLGRCFVGDDFFRLVDNSGEEFDIYNLGTDGFFRPINHLSFFLSIKIAGYKPFFYGCFNFGLYLAIMVLSYFVFSKALASKLLASLLVFFWVINFKVAEATLLGMVGRTELLWVFFALLALCIFRFNVCVSFLPYCVFLLLALLSKESAVVMVLIAPLLLKVSGFSNKKVFCSFLGAVLALAAYFYLRSKTGAWGVTDAPSFYAYNFGVGHLFLRTAYYILNGVGLSLVPCVIFRHFRANKAALLWFLMALFVLAPTVPLPNKSYLYVFFAIPFMVAGCLVCVKDAEKIEVKKVLFVLLLVTVCIMPFSQMKFVKSLLRDYTVQAVVDNVQNETALPEKADFQYAVKVKKLSK